MGMFITALIIAVTVLVGMDYLVGSTVSATATSIPWTWIIIGLIILVPIFGRRWLPSGTFTVSAKSLKKALTFSLVLAAFFLALYEVDPTAPLFNTPEGYSHIAAYFILSIIAGMVDINLEKKQKFVAALILGCTFALIGPRTGMLLPGLGEKLHITGLLSGFSTARAYCSGKVQQATLDMSGKDLNPGGNCAIELHEKSAGQCVTIYDRFGDSLGNDCGSGTNRHVNVDGKYPSKFAAANAPVVPVTYVLCDRPGKLRIVADGCP